MKKYFVSKKDSNIAFALTVGAMIAASFVAVGVVMAYNTATGKEMAGIWPSLIFAQAAVLLAGGSFVLVRKISIKEVIGLKRVPVGIVTQQPFAINVLLQILNVFLLALLSMSLIVFAYPILSGFALLLDRLGYIAPPDPFQGIAMGGLEWAGLVVFGCIAPAIGEELIFRGIVLEGYRKKNIDFGAIVISAALFMLMHMNIEQMIHPFMLGLAFGFVYCVTRSIWSTVLLHFFNNLFALVISAIDEKGAAAVSFFDGKWWLMFPALAVAAAVLFYIWKTRDKTEYLVPLEKTYPQGSGRVLLMVASVVICVFMLIFSAFAGLLGQLFNL